MLIDNIKPPISGQSSEVTHKKNLMEIEQQKLDFANEKRAINKSNQRELTQIRSEQEREILEETKKKEKILGEIQKNIEETKILTDQEIANLKKQQSDNKTHHEKKLQASEENFNKTFKESEKELQDLLSRKEKILEKYNQDIYKNYELNSIKSQDNFYSTLTIPLALYDEGDRYVVEVPIGEHEVKNLNITSKNKEIRVSLTRNFKSEDHNEMTGEKNTTARTESLFSKVPLESIVDPKSGKTSYKEGYFIFEVKKA